MKVSDIIYVIICIIIIIAILFIGAYVMVGPNIGGIVIWMVLEVVILAIGWLVAWAIFGR